MLDKRRASRLIKASETGILAVVFLQLRYYLTLSEEPDVSASNKNI